MGIKISVTEKKWYKWKACKYDRVSPFGSLTHNPIFPLKLMYPFYTWTKATFTLSL